MRKGIFAASAAAAALVAHSRRITKLLPEVDCKSQIASIFDSQHKFVVELRNNLEHVVFLEADPWVAWGLDRRRAIGFEFRTSDLLFDGEFTQSARTYLQQAGNKIDVATLFTTYGEKVEIFYEWMRDRIDTRLPIAVADYRRCQNSHRRAALRKMYRLLLTTWIRRGIDPYVYLSEYLDPEELEEIQRLPARSVEQINRIIELVDQEHLCDQEIRKLMLRLFGVPDD